MPIPDKFNNDKEIMDLAKQADDIFFNYPLTQEQFNTIKNFPVSENSSREEIKNFLLTIISFKKSGVAVKSPQPAQQTSNDAAALCKSTNKIPDLYNSLTQCTDSVERGQMATFIPSTTDPSSEFDLLNATYLDLVLSGDSMFGTMPTSTALQDVKKRNQELLARKEQIKKGINQKEAAVERSDRDFIDTKEALPERMNDKKIRVIDDYTMVLLVVSYLFMSLSLIFWYAQINSYAFSAIIKALIGVTIVGVLLFFLAIKFL